MIVSAFSKGLGVAVAAKATADLAGLPPTVEVSLPDPEATEVAVSEAKGNPQPVKLQLCKWHAVEAIKQRLEAARRYKKEKHEETVDQI